MKNKTKKKSLPLLFLIVLLAFVFTGGCGGKNEEPSKKEKKAEVAKTQLDDYVGKPLTETMAQIEALGYTATYEADGVDFTEFINDVKDDYLTGEIKEDPEKKTAAVTLKLIANAEAEAMEANLKEVLPEGTAWVAAKRYGKEMYGDGFDLHYLIGKIDASAENETTWFLKAECTVDGSKMTCEAKVTGTESTPEVIDFSVY